MAAMATVAPAKSTANRTETWKINWCQNTCRIHFVLSVGICWLRNIRFSSCSPFRSAYISFLLNILCIMISELAILWIVGEKMTKKKNDRRNKGKNKWQKQHFISFVLRREIWLNIHGERQWSIFDCWNAYFFFSCLRINRVFAFLKIFSIFRFIFNLLKIVQCKFKVFFSVDY